MSGGRAISECRAGRAVQSYANLAYNHYVVQARHKK
jgi:hypothetical protein